MAQEPLAGLYVPQRPLSEAIFCVRPHSEAKCWWVILSEKLREHSWRHVLLLFRFMPPIAVTLPLL
jgi:hypothetical protein